MNTPTHFWGLHNKDCLEGLKELQDNSIDVIVTDPPYGMSFMGKNWDKALPDPEVFKECHRVLKPGSFAFVMSAPRSDLQSRMSLLLEDAGFNIGFTPIYWTYATGFPKAMDISKAVDKKLKKERKVVGQREDILKKQAADIRRGSRKIKESYDAGAPTRNNGFKTISADITEPNSDEAKQLSGLKAGFQPKPAVEVVIVAMKPLSEKTYVDQALKSLIDEHTGRGGTWIDDCRIPYHNEQPDGSGSGFGASSNDYGNNKPNYSPNDTKTPHNGRFPANLLVDDDVLNDGETTKSPSGKVKRQPRKAQVFTDKNCGFKSENLTDSGYGDSGSKSRYFDLNAWWVKRLSELPENIQKTFPFVITPKANKSEKNKGVEKNNHPTVKPLSLMSYLITLGSREGDMVLDPYSGSGSTLIAAKILKRKWIGYEIDKEYYEIAKARMEVWE